MIGVLLLGILVSVFVIGGLGILAFASVAFGRARQMHSRTLPLLTGESLKAWAASRSQVTAAQWLGLQPERRQADGLARSIEMDAGQILDEAIFRESSAAQATQVCREGERSPQVTAPEVFAIVEEIHKLPVRWQEELKLRVSSAHVDSSICPLLTAQRMCLCAAARPLGCRGRCLAGFDSSAEAAKWAETLEEGLIEGLQQTLADAGLDGARYGLNEALSTALHDATAPSRWQRGERLMAADA